MKTQTTYMGRKLTLMAMLFTFLLSGFHSFAQIVDYKPTILVSEDWVNNNWQNDTKTTNTYDSHGFLTNSLAQDWNTTTNTYVDVARFIYTNNVDGLPTQVISQTWNTTTNVWENGIRITNTYNGAGKPLTAVYDIWFDPIWQPLSKLTNTYGVNGFLTNSLTQSWDFVTSTFKNNSQINFTNNANGTVNFSIEQEWNTATSLWDNSQRQSYTYNGNKILVVTTESWIGGNWVNFSRETNTYNSSGYIVNELFEKWNTTSSIWINDSQSIISNNASGIPTQIVSQDWVESLSVWVNDQRTTLFYGQLGVNDFASSKNFAVYPVPAHDRITIKANDNVQGSNYSIIDETGRVFKSGKLDIEETSIDINYLATGVYFFQIGQDSNQTVKIIKR